MEQAVKDFFHDFRQELMSGAEVNKAFQLEEFLNKFSNELVETGLVDGFELCHYRPSRGGMRVDGYWYDDDVLTIFIADHDCRTELEFITQTEVDAIFKRASNFFEASNKALYEELEETSPGYDLSRKISDSIDSIREVRFFLLSERILSERFKSVENILVAGVPAKYHIWDISRLYRQHSSQQKKEILTINFLEKFNKGIPCLVANVDVDAYQSYLAVLQGDTLSTLYEEYGSQLLEQNVRSFLQARGKVNKGIRTTILNSPDMFFAYNNGITATAQDVQTYQGPSGLEIICIKDLQIVNGGQTTASLFHTRRKDKASLKHIFVQMKLSVINKDSDAEEIVPRISEYANTQNRVSAADFFSNHSFHIRIEEFSRRIWAPAMPGAQRETKWFYERVRGQYANEQSNLTQAEKRKFQAQYPRSQMFTKTDLAKFDNVWDEDPKWVNLGAQKNFVQFARRIGKEWNTSPSVFNETYYKRLVARAIIFRRTEKFISKQTTWYKGGYRANIVAYTIAVLNELCKKNNKSIDYLKIWNEQGISAAMVASIEVISEIVNCSISSPPPGSANISEWCKTQACWYAIQKLIPEVNKNLPDDFMKSLISADMVRSIEKDAQKTQKIDDGIDAQKLIFTIPSEQWSQILAAGSEKSLWTDKEAGILNIAIQIPKKIPTDKQSAVLLKVLEKAREEGIYTG